MINADKVSCISDLTDALRVVAQKHENKHGLDDWACSLLDVARLIDDSFDSSLAIGGTVECDCAAKEAAISRLEMTNRRLLAQCGQHEKKVQHLTSLMFSAVDDRFDYDGACESVKANYQNVSRLPVCPHCKGRGEVKPLFYVYECSHCHGTGRDTYHSIETIKAMQALINAQFDAINVSYKLLFKYALSAEERTDYCAEKFYQD